MESDEIEAQAREAAESIAVSLVVRKDSAGAPLWDASWRDSTRAQKLRRIGPAWLDPGNPFMETGASRERRRAASWEKSWTPKAGRPRGGAVTERKAHALARDLVIERERELLQAQAAKRDADALAGRGFTDAPTVKDAADAWIAHRKSRGRGLRPSTEIEYRSVLQAHIVPALGAHPVADVTRADVLAWREGLRTKTTPTGSPLSPRTMNKALTVLSGVFAAAMRPVDLGGFALSENPCKWVERLPEDDEQEREPLTLEEVAAVARVMRTGEHRADRRYAVGERKKGRKTATREPTAAERAEMARQDEQDAALVLLLGYCGVRSGEAAALRWRNVVFSEGRVRVERSFSAGVEGPTKGRERRWTLLPVQVAQPLAQMGQREHFTADDDLVFVGTTGSYVDMSAFRRRFKRAVTLAGIARPVRVHDLRHGATTDLRSVFDADAVRKLVGHKDARTAQRYAHARDADTDAAARWSAHIAASIAPETPPE